MSDTTPELHLPPALVAKAINDALSEDLGLAGDITTTATVAPGTRCKATLGARKPGVIAGLQLFEAAFRSLDPEIEIDVVAPDGSNVKAGQTIARISGNARAILAGERVALNFVGHMSGIATLTHRFVKQIAGTRAHIIDTRKTTPGLRAFEKVAVRAGGGINHRFGLFDAILIKDNHIVAAGGIGPAMERARSFAGHMVKIEIEVTTLNELDEAMACAPDAVLLDNMDTATLETAVKKVAGRALTEASGGVNLDTVRAIAETGVDLISVGALTHSAPTLDVGLDFETAT